MFTSELDLELEIHAAQAMHATGQPHDAMLCGTCLLAGLPRRRPGRHRASRGLFRFPRRHP